MYILGAWLIQRSGKSLLSASAESTERQAVFDPHLVYTKMPDVVVDQLRDLITAGKATQATAWLWMVIARRLNRRTNRVEATVIELMRATGMSRDTILKHTAILESAGLVQVDRHQVSRIKNGINVYHLAGAALGALLSPIVDSQSSDLTSESRIQTPPVQPADRKTTLKATQKQTPAAVETQSTHPGENLSETIEADPPLNDSLKHDQPAVERLVALGVEHYKAREMAARYSMERINAVVERCQTQRISNKAAFAVKALTNNWSWDKVVKPRQEEPEDGLRYLSGPYAKWIMQDMGMTEADVAALEAEALAHAGGLNASREAFNYGDTEAVYEH